LFLVSTLTEIKGFHGSIYTDETYFWFASYNYGLVRRGLLGSLLHPLLVDADWATFQVFIAITHISSLIILPFLAGIALLRCRQNAPIALVALAGAVFSTSPFLGEISLHAGYPDVILSLFIAAVALSLEATSRMVTAILLVVACALHELCYLVLVPIVAFRVSLDPKASALDIGWIAIGLSLPLMFIAIASTQPPDLVLSMVRIGLSPQTATAQATTSLNQSFLSSVLAMQKQWETYPVNGALGILYAGLPGMILSVIFWRNANDVITRRTSNVFGQAALHILYFGSCLGAIAVLIIAWDLSRMVSFTTLTALLTGTTLPASKITATPKRWVIWLIPIAFALLPVNTLYFDYGRAINTDRLRLVCSPCADIGVRLIHFYNRNLTPEAKASIDDMDRKKF